MHLDGDRLPANSGLAGNMQIENECVFFAVASARNYYGKDSYGTSLLFDMNVNGKPIDPAYANQIAGYGLPGNMVSSVYNQYLTGYYSKDVSSAISSGYPVLGIYSLGLSGYHDVLITGLGFGGQYTYHNSATDTYQSSHSHRLLAHL